MRLLTLRLLCCALLLLLWQAGGAVWAQEQPTPSRPLGVVLVEVARALNVDLMYDPALVANHQAPKGEAFGSPTHQLQALVRHANLTVRQLPSGTYVLMPAQPLPPPSEGLVQGLVRDALTGDPLPGAHVLILGLAVDVADAHGRFHFSSVPPGDYQLSASYVGYQAVLDSIRVRAGETIVRRFQLAPQPIYISPLIVEGERTQTRFDAYSQIRPQRGLAPHTHGVADAVRGLNNLMGVRVGDAMADVHVQGGESGEHQFRLDGAPLFEPVHLRGLLGAFNPFAIKQIQVHKAGFGAAHGSHIAGVIEAEHTVRSLDGRHLDVQVDPLSVNGRAFAALPRWGQLQGDLMVAGRRSLWQLHQPAQLSTLLEEWNAPDAFLPKASLLAAQEQYPALAARLGQTKDTLKYNPQQVPNLGFSDVHAATRLRIGTNHRLYGSVYRGWNRIDGNGISVEVAPDSTGGDPYVSRDDYRWTNSVAQIQYVGVLNAKTLLTTRVRKSRYHLQHTYNASQNAVRPLGIDFVVRLPKDVEPADDGNRIRELAVESRIDRMHGTGHLAQFGISAVRTDHRFSIEDMYFKPIQNEASNWQFTAFGEEQHQVSEALKVTVGSRLTWLPQRQRFYLEPRLQAQYHQRQSRIGPWSARLASGLYRQFINQFEISSISPSALLPAIRFWLPVDSTMRPPQAYHAALDLAWEPTPGWLLRAESYYKYQPRLLQIDYQQLWSHLVDEESTGTMQSAFLRMGKGYGYGTSLGVEHRGQTLRWSLQYEYTVTRRTPLFRTDVAYERAPWTEPHRLELALDWRPADAFIATARWRGSWGRAWGFRRAYYDYLATDSLGHRNPVYGDFDLREPEAHRLKPFYQFDLGAAYSHTFGPVALQVRVDVQNLLNRANVADWSLLAVPNEAGTTYRRIARNHLPRTASLAVRLRW